ncbi:MAG: dipeptide epimerase [Planctomycetota bacterium]|nr:dipeptide epimerase [Planctomycetota bacterium]
MKLTSHIEQLQLRHTFTISRGSQDVVPVVVTALESDGVRGLGEAAPSDFYGETAESVEGALRRLDGFLADCDPLHYRDLLEGAAERLGENRGALCALDLALFDWVSRRFGQPLHRLLGLDPGKIPLSSFTVGIDTTERMVEKLREASHYPIIKVKLGIPEDIEVVRSLRKETDATFRVDANCGWTVRETIEKSAELAALGVEFIEQPLPPAELEAMEEVYRESRLPVIADENSVVPADVPRLVGKFHGINIKLVKCGGILPALRMVHLARTFGMKVMFGCMIESSVGITAAAQIGALADYLDLDGNVLITNDPYAGVRNESGRLILPEGWVERR